MSEWETYYDPRCIPQGIMRTLCILCKILFVLELKKRKKGRMCFRVIWSRLVDMWKNKQYMDGDKVWYVSLVEKDGKLQNVTTKIIE